MPRDKNPSGARRGARDTRQAAGGLGAREEGQGGGGGPGDLPYRSAATVRMGTDVAPADRQQILDLVESLLGRGATLQDVASLVGAPADGEVRFGVSPSNPSRLHVEVGGDSVYMKRDIYRSGGKKYISNEYFVAHGGGQGLGLKVFASQVANATKLGFSAIRTYAAGSGAELAAAAASGRRGAFNGFYTWPRFGYNRTLSRAEKGMLPGKLKGSRTVLDVMATKSGRDWWRANGKSGSMTFDLKPGSRSRKTLQEYLRERGT